MRAASFLRMTNCNAFAGRFPCPIPWAWKMGSIFDSHPARLSNLGDKIWSLDAVEWKMPPVFDSWPGRGYDLGGQIRVSIWSRIWFGGSDWGIDLPGRLIWGVRLDHRPSGKGNLWGRIRLFTCFTPKIFTHYLIVEWIWTPIFFENKVIDLLDSLSKGARFATRVGREWKQEHMLEGLKAWKWKEAPPLPPLRIGTRGLASFQTDKGRRNWRNPLKIQAETLHWEGKICSCLFLFWEANEIECK